MIMKQKYIHVKYFVPGDFPKTKLLTILFIRRRLVPVSNQFCAFELYTHQKNEFSNHASLYHFHI